MSEYQYNHEFQVLDFGRWPHTRADLRAESLLVAR